MRVWSHKLHLPHPRLTISKALHLKILSGKMHANYPIPLIPCWIFALHKRPLDEGQQRFRDKYESNTIIGRMDYKLRLHLDGLRMSPVSDSCIWIFFHLPIKFTVNSFKQSECAMPTTRTLKRLAISVHTSCISVKLWLGVTLLITLENNFVFQQ